MGLRPKRHGPPLLAAALTYIQKTDLVRYDRLKVRFPQYTDLKIHPGGPLWIGPEERFCYGIKFQTKVCNVLLMYR